jgi:pimeloyl-ACP methyl ester carboxylesterase
VRPSEEHFISVGEIELCWQQFGNDSDPPLLMIMGLGAQMVLWPDGLLELLAERGFRVIRFDNRDAGRSTVLDGAPAPTIREALNGDVGDAPYTLSDMAADAIGLLDELGLEHAHVAGSSFGAMVAQTLAIEHPERVLSLASISSTTGDPDVGKPTPEGLETLTTRPPADREGYIESTVRARAVIGSPGFPRDEQWARQNAALSFDRGYHPDGTMRQVVAIIASGDRTPRLRKLRVPTVVIHGDADPLIDISGGRATAGAIEDSRLVVIEGMGHDLPRGAWRQVADAIAANATRAGFPAQLASPITREEDR